MRIDCYEQEQLQKKQEENTLPEDELADVFD